ncbi:hypothetical protein ACP4OV_026250 [Aristida adscensionis]
MSPQISLQVVHTYVAVEVAGDRPVSQGDSAAVQVADMCATESGATVPRGVAAAAQAAADENATRDEEKVKLRDVRSVLCGGRRERHPR